MSSGIQRRAFTSTSEGRKYKIKINISLPQVGSNLQPGVFAVTLCATAARLASIKSLSSLLIFSLEDLI